MGGYGSGRWHAHTKKDTVEDSRFLDANRWMQEGILREGMRHYGGWTWRNAHTGEQTSSISYEVDTIDMAFPWVRLYYTFTESQVKIEYRIRLQTTPTPRGTPLVVYVPAGCPRTRLRSSCGQAVPATWRSLLWLSPLLRADVYQWPRERQAREFSAEAPRGLHGAHRG